MARLGHRVIPVCLSQTALGQLTSTPRHSQPTVRATLDYFALPSRKRPEMRCRVTPNNAAI